jgi:hypothetical protein
VVDRFSDQGTGPSSVHPGLGRKRSPAEEESQRQSGGRGSVHRSIIRFRLE